MRRPRTPRALADCCKVVRLDDDGLTYAAIGAKIGMRQQTVLKWRTRFLAHRPAGLMVKAGVVIGECYKRHRHQEFIKFLNTINEVVKATEPAGTSIHLVLDNDATHKTPAQEAPRVPPALHAHQRQLAEPGRAGLRRSHREAAPPRRVHQRRVAGEGRPRLPRRRNDNATPFVWTADANTILGRVARNRATISKSGH